MGSCSLTRQLCLAFTLVNALATSISPELLGFFQKLQDTSLTKSSRMVSGLGWGQECHPSYILRPKTTEELADVIGAISRETSDAGTHFHVRALSSKFMSLNNFTCPEEVTGTIPEIHSVGIDMGAMTSVTTISDEMITVQAGMTFEALEDILLSNKLSLPGVTVAPHLSSFTIGAALMTASHGSSLVGPASISPYIIRAILVDGTGQIHVLETPGDLLEGSLGMLGIVTEITLEVGPARKVAVKQLQEEDTQMVGDLREIIENSEAVSLDVTWSPAAGMYTARVWHDTEANTIGESKCIWMKAPLEWLRKANRKLVQDQHDLHDKDGNMCQVLGELSSLPYFTPSEGTEYDVNGISVGWLNHMTAPACHQGPLLGVDMDHKEDSSQSDCFWRQAKWTPYEISIGSEDFADWVEDVRAIMAHARGCPAFLFTFRFNMESDAPMSMSSGKQVVAIEIATHSGLGSTMPIKHQNLFEEIVQMSLCKYEARPHWALGTNRMFVGPCPIRDTYGADFDQFLEQREKYDPSGIFIPPLFAHLMNRSVGRHYPGCAVTGDCYCQEDAHCGPRHRCVPGVVFKEYNTCLAEAWIRGEEL